MTIKLRIISGEDENFLREIEISGEATFLELHNFIQETLNFDEGQMASFFITDEEWHKNEEITLIDMAMDESSNSFIMSDTSLNQFIKEEKQRFIYVFDFFNERNLFIETFEISNSPCPEPLCTKSLGEAPSQLDLSELLGEAEADMPADKNMDYLEDDPYDFSDTDFDNDPMISYTDDLEDL